MVYFLKQFYLKYPDYATNDFLISGESYGGKYEPNIAKAILDSNKATPESIIPLKSVLIGDGLVDLILQRTNVKALPKAAGYLTDDILPQYEILD